MCGQRQSSSAVICKFGEQLLLPACGGQQHAAVAAAAVALMPAIEEGCHFGCFSNELLEYVVHSFFMAFG
jgi:hypothetical protein